MRPQSHVSALDIRHLPGFSIPSHVCAVCRAISLGEMACDVCGSPQVRDLNPTRIPYATGVEKMVGDRFRHAEQFAIAVPMGRRVWDAASVIAQLCDLSRLYIHLVTYSIDTPMLDILERALLRGVEVAGFIGLRYDPADPVSLQLARLQASFGPRMRLALWQPSNPDRRFAPHQKLLVCDGCVAITGSMNFTQAAFRKQDADVPSEFVWPFTDSRSVVAINNQYISPLFVPHLAARLRGR